MASLAGAMYAATGIPAAGATTQVLREDLIDVAMNLDKQKTAAVFLAAPKTVANGLVHEWLLDQLPAVDTTGQPEGNDWASSTIVSRTRMNNAVQTFMRGFAVSKDAIEYSLKGKAPGVSNEYEHQVNAFLLATEQSIDTRIVGVGTGTGQTSIAAASSGVGTVGALMGGIRAWSIATCVSTVAITASVTNNVQVSIAGAWSRSKFLGLHEYMFMSGANPDTLAVSPGVKADITADILGEVAAGSANASGGLALTPVVPRQVHTDASGSEFTQDIQFMRTDFGRVAILVDRFIPNAATASNANIGGAYFLYERSKLRVAFWRPLRHYPIPPSGDAVKGYVHCGVTLENLHPNAVAVAHNITT